MRKEVLLAIAIGFAVGIVITFGIWTANKSLKDLPKNSPSPTQTPANTTPVSTSPKTSTTPAPTKSASAITLDITSPEDELLVDKSALKLTGKTAPNATVSIIAESSEQIVTADSTGAFTADITLTGGYNTINITAVDNAGNTATQSRIITYTTAKL